MTLQPVSTFRGYVVVWPAMMDLPREFERARSQLRAKAARLLGPDGELDDALQETWLRASRAHTDAIENVGGWLTIILSRVCLDMLRARRRSAHSIPHEQSPTVDALERAEQIGLALCVLLERLSPAERIAYVMHDLLAIPFEEVAPVVGRTSVSAKKLASRARTRLREATVPPRLQPRRDLTRAFLGAARAGDLDALLAMLAPDVTRQDGAKQLRGARAVAEETRGNAARARHALLASVDGMPGILVAPAGRPRLAIVLTYEGAQVTHVAVHHDLTRLHIAPWADTAS